MYGGNTVGPFARLQWVLYKIRTAADRLQGLGDRILFTEGFSATREMEISVRKREKEITPARICDLNTGVGDTGLTINVGTDEEAFKKIDEKSIA